MTSIVVTINDIFDQLWSENKRLLKELLFANKCLNILDELKTELNLIHNKFETQLNTEYKFNDLRHQLNDICNQRHDKTFAENNGKLLRCVTKDGTENYFVEDTDKSDSDNIQEVENNNEKQINDKDTKEVVDTSSSSHQLIPPIKPQSVATNQFHGNLLFLKIPPNIPLLKALDLKNIKIKPLSATDLPLIKLSNITTNPNNNVVQTSQKSSSFSSLLEPKDSNELIDTQKEMQCINNNYEEDRHEEEIEIKCEPIDETDPQSNQSLRSYDFDEDITKIDRKIDTKIFVKEKCRYDGCDKILISRGAKWYHEKVYHPSDTTKTLKCRYTDCQFECQLNSQMIKHMPKHSNKSFVCPISGCNKLFKGLYSLKCHKRLHTNTFAFNCNFDGCQQQFRTKSELTMHLAQHKSEPTLKCLVKDCQEMFFSESERVKHRKQIHNYNKPSNPMRRCNWSGCDYFGKYLTTHMEVHTGRKPYPCVWPQCDKRFRYKIRLQQHMNVHNNVKPFACHWPGCDYRCAAKPNIIFN
ncbi:zinc finger protein 761-like [Oppia nitens]|uniref:zinc finger protein 761-like n=1 Tax=Oppia nitens TaxID=1686743 RepID=UPI0023DC9DA3|nr:zinc finger protein 761-like [Oppia nitens]